MSTSLPGGVLARTREDITKDTPTGIRATLTGHIKFFQLEIMF